MPNPFKVSLYIRVSTDRQANEGDSMDEQERELKRFCEFKQFLIHKVHIEAGRSAKNTNRPEYQKLLADIGAEKINAVVVKKLDRLSRSLLDFEQFMTTAQTHNVEFISIKENFDTTNAMGKAMLRVALVFAQLEREQTAERIRDVMDYRAQQGMNNGGTRPYGYCSVSKELIPDKKEAKVIQIMFEKFIELKSTTRVAEYLNSLGLRNRNGKLWDKRRADDVLKRPVYIGKNCWKGVLYKANHQPILSESCFNKVQAIFNSHSPKLRERKISGLLRGLIRCGYCQTFCTVNYTQKSNGHRYQYYRCTHTMNTNLKPCKAGYYGMSETNKAVFAKILEYSTEKQLQKIKLAMNQANQKTEKDLALLNTQNDTQQKQLDQIKTKKEKYLDSLVTQPFNTKERQRINDKIEEYELEEKQLEANLYRIQFELSAKAQSLQSIDGFKQEIIAFKINHESMAEPELIAWLNRNITSVTYTKEDIQIDFKLLK